MPNNRVGGFVFFKINGVQYALRGNLKYKVGTSSAEEILGQDGLHGFKRKPEAQSLECDITDRGNISIAQLNDLEGVTVTAEMDNGKTFILQNAKQMNHLENDTGEGQFTLRFVGTSANETLST